MSTGAPKVNGTFVSEKIARVRWVPETYNSPNAFVTGSWGGNGTASSVKLWRHVPNADFDANQPSSATGSVYADATELDGAVLVPRCIASAPASLTGDISGLEFVDGEHLVVGSSDGFVSLLHVSRGLRDDAAQLRERHRFQHVHRFGGEQPAACTALAVCASNVASVGEDGRLCVLSVAGALPQTLRTFDAADSCTPTAVAYVSDAELFTGNRMGSVRMFDVRANGDQPIGSMPISCDDEKKPNAVTALACHPTQRHILLGGSEEGSITVWDLRNPGYAASYLTAHASAITALAFHPTAPARLFTASEGGELFQWTHTVGGVVGARVGPADDRPANGEPAADEPSTNPWLSGERVKNMITWSPLIGGQDIRKSINAFDAVGPKIICSCDNEALYLVENIY